MPVISLRRLRILSGLILGAFLVTHFANHALGLISVEAMDDARHLFNKLWRSWPGTVLLYGSLGVHFALALRSLYARRTIRMPAREAVQITFGLLLPFLLVPHVAATRIEWALTRIDSPYEEVLLNLWSNPDAAAKQAVALVIAWLHFCFGVWFWLRHRAWFGRVALPLYTAALLVPVLALLGFAEGGEEMLTRAGAPVHMPHPAIADIRFWLFAVLAGAIAATFAARALRAAVHRAHRVAILYPDERRVVVPKGFSVLEASRSAGIAHASVCGARGRCSTCRVRIVEGLTHLPEPAAQEAATLKRIGAAPDIRLACQLRPTHDLSVVPLVGVPGSWNQPVPGRAGTAPRASAEREVAVLFCDLRDFTGLSEAHLPFDTVFILNRYFAMVGEAVEEAGGRLDKFIGDGALVLFGLQTDVGTASRQAVAAAGEIARRLETLNRSLAHDLARPLRLAMGLHAGPAIIGQMGYGPATQLTAIGDTINIASRLEGLAKQRNATLVASADVAVHAGLSLSGYGQEVVTLRGRTTGLAVVVVHDAATLPPATEATVVPAGDQ